MHSKELSYFVLVFVVILATTVSFDGQMGPSLASKLYFVAEDMNSLGLKQKMQETPGPILPAYVDFCLRERDSGLAPQSRSKVLNSLTNQVFSALLIGYTPRFAVILGELSQVREDLEFYPCMLGEREDGDLSTPELKEAACTKDILAARIYVDFLKDLLLSRSVHERTLGGLYDKGYKLLLTMLRDAGVIGVGTGINIRRAEEANICLSVLDRMQPGVASFTSELNSRCNIVARCLLYGNRDDREALADDLKSFADHYPDEWAHDPSAKDPEVRSFLLILADLCSSVEETTEGERELRAASAVSRGVKEPGAGALSKGRVAVSGIRADVLAFEDDVRVTLLHSLSSYRKALDRVFSVMLEELGRRRVAPVNDVLGAFKMEQDVRQSITEPNWNRHPEQLVGDWAMYDSALSKGVNVVLKADGTVDVPFLSYCEGMSWAFTPGPAHLDTLTFYVLDSVETFEYIGFVDRGQRTETTFSGRPIKVAGSIVARAKDGTKRQAGSFSMQQSPS